MKARIKATGEIVEFTRVVDKYIMTHHSLPITFDKDELDFDIEDDSNYWDRLTHQAAISAMQGIMSNPVGFESIRCTVKDHDKKVAETAVCFAKELVEGLKLIRSN